MSALLHRCGSSLYHRHLLSLCIITDSNENDLNRSKSATKSEMTVTKAAHIYADSRGGCSEDLHPPGLGRQRKA